MADDDKNILHGMELETEIPNISFGKKIYDHLLSSQIRTELMVDVFTGHKITAQQLLQESCNLAEALRITGYGSDVVLAIISENSIPFFIPTLASFFNKTIATLLNSAYTSVEMTHCLIITKPKIVFSSKQCLKKLLDIRNNLSYVKKFIILDSDEDVEGATSLKNFVDVALRGRRILTQNFQTMEFDAKKTPALVMYSSGTTGLAKGVTLSHFNLVFQHEITMKAEFDLNHPESSVGLSPFYHSLGFNGTLYSIFNNKRVLVMNRFDEDVFLKAVQDYKVSVLPLPPPLMVLFAKSPKLQKYDISSVQTVGSGAAPIRKQVQEEIAKRFKLSSVSQGYGMTEATFALIILPPGLNKPESCGFLVASTSCKVRDPETGRTLGPKQPGELCFKGPQIMLGYYNDEKATKEAFTEDGWLRSGDIGYYDEDECFYIVDRLKELIKYKGYQVAPAELEGLLLGHPEVKDAAVVGKPDESCGELPTAFIVKKEGSKVVEKEIQKYIEGLVSPQKWLRGGVIFISEIPKTPTGKLLRRELKNLLGKYKSKL